MGVHSKGKKGTLNDDEDMEEEEEEEEARPRCTALTCHLGSAAQGHCSLVVVDRSCTCTW